MSNGRGARIREEARKLGFELVGITAAKPVPDYVFFRWWLDQGYAATMTYLHRQSERRGDPEKVLPGVRSVICCGINYYVGDTNQFISHSTPSGGLGGTRGTFWAGCLQTNKKFPEVTGPDPALGGISRHAWGEDYHVVVGERLRKLEDFIHKEIDSAAGTKSHVDTGPVLERSYAARAGLGWIGKNNLLINNGLGSFAFLGEVLTTLEFDKDEYDRPQLDQCGSCTRCLDACPTGALVEPRVLDANRCISYLTTAYKGELTPGQKGMIGNHLYGCDICQEVCPFNEGILVSPLKEFLYTHSPGTTRRSSGSFRGRG